MNLDVNALLDKLRRIEALHAGATTPGERDAAANAIRHIQQRLARSETVPLPRAAVHHGHAARPEMLRR